MQDLLKVEKRGKIAIMTINRPDQLNPLGKEGDGDAFVEVTKELAADKELRCCILTGAGRAFSAGGDLKAMKDRSGAFGGSPFEVKNGYTQNIHKIVNSLWNFELPLVVPRPLSFGVHIVPAASIRNCCREQSALG